MVNTGLPSRACENCRQRRVTVLQCDYRRPSCERCERAGRPCAYRDLESRELSFRIRTPASYGHQVDNNNDTKKDQGQQPRSPPPSPAHALTEPWDVHIIPLILSQFSFPLPDGGRFYGSLECFTAILPTMRPDSIMRFACDAVGYVFLVNKAPSRELATRHRRAYGQALQRLRRALEVPILQRDDGVLLAVWLLCLYELMLGTPPDAPGLGPSNWAAHSMALIGLLRARGREQFRTSTGCQLFQLCYHHIQTCALQSGTEPDPEAKQWFETIQSTVNIANPLYLFLPFFFQGDEAARIISKTLNAWGRSTQTQEKLGIIEAAFQATRELEITMDQSWERLQSCSHHPGNAPAPTMTTAAAKGAHLLLHIRNHIDTCVLRVNSVLLELLRETNAWSSIWSETRKDLDHLQQSCVDVARDRADRILLTLPQLMPENNAGPLPGWANAMRLMWPARVIILASPATRGIRAEAAGEVLRRIAYEVGIMQAVGSFFQPVSLS
ncbi:hypothetical protein BJY01DRAFT_254014 [Aspergillus pseudoustus]|uniref:Zn(2)-C6 fungal-type domain-containing protein n=1 Tax=Aspergillus pseudoustus TaxID=1810923 RepID=A0ABR4IWP5_9EURO